MYFATPALLIPSNVSPVNTINGQFKGVHVFTTRMWMSASPAGLRPSVHRVTSRSWPGNADFYPLSTLSGRTGALIRGFCLQQKSPASGYSCSGAVVWLWRRELESHLFLLFRLLDPVSHQSQGCSATRTQSLGGRDPVVLSGPSSRDGGQVLTMRSFVVV